MSEFFSILWWVFTCITWGPWYIVFSHRDSGGHTSGLCEGLMTIASIIVIVLQFCFLLAFGAGTAIVHYVF